MYVLVLRYLDGDRRHADVMSYSSMNDYMIRSLRAKMSQYFGKDAFQKGYIELLNYETGEKKYIRTKEELIQAEGEDF
ncbi:hypothetical protein [Bacillus wiedmannii]|uniref:hypothetical protein n=1 Tax=Bacillus wiedmannii TaxID=1890302 RepID=UPI000BF1D519|nr:hypothetical protein [Bacillus wiedmannii]PEO36744.1 hypothetical protein CN555_21315 [Bacillus wiedmannii]